MHDQMAFTHGTIYIQNVTRFFVILLALTVDISLVRNVNNQASKIPNKPCLHLNGNSPCSNAHLVEHKSSFLSDCGASNIHLKYAGKFSRGQNRVSKISNV